MTLELERIQINQKAALTSGTVRKYSSENGKTTGSLQNKVRENWTKLKARGKALSKEQQPLRNMEW